VTFLNIPLAGPQSRLVLGGGGLVAQAIRRASLALDPYVPRWDRDFRDLGVADSGAIRKGARIMLGPGASPEEVPVIYVGAGVPVLPRVPAVWYVGGRRYGREDRDRARHEHRLLPLAEISLEVGLRTALLELGGQAFHLVVDLDVLDPVWAPAVARPTGLGAEPRELWKAFETLRASTLGSFEIRGLLPGRDADGQSARLAAEAVRDLALLVWGR
jgi:arginase family enzyme